MRLHWEEDGKHRMTDKRKPESAPYKYKKKSSEVRRVPQKQMKEIEMSGVSFCCRVLRGLERHKSKEISTA